MSPNLKAFEAAYNQAKSLGHVWHVVGLEHDWEALQVALDARAEGQGAFPLPQPFNVVYGCLTTLEHLIGIDSDTYKIEPAATATLTVTPAHAIIPQRLIIPEHICNLFVVNDLRAGVDPLIDTAVSSAVFRGDSSYAFSRIVRTVIGMDLSVTVTNISAEPQRFEAIILAHPNIPMFNRRYKDELDIETVAQHMQTKVSFDDDS